METAVSRAVDAVEQHRAGDTPRALRVTTLNPEMVMRARRHPEFAAALERSGLTVADGVGLVWALRRRGHAVARVPGVELVERYAARATALGHRLALVGAAPGVAARAGEALMRRHPGLRVVATSSDDPGPALAQRLRQSGVDTVLAAYSMEGQALFLDRHLDDCGAALGIGVGGTLDILAGRVRRAPAPVRRLGLEWLWRLALQPRRLRRQLELPRFWWLARSEARSRPV